MTLFDFRCPAGHTISRRFPMGKAPDTVACDDHGTAAKRVLSRVTTPAFPGSHKAEYRT